MTKFERNIELLLKNKEALGYNRSCFKYVKTTVNSFWRDNAISERKCDTDFENFINKHLKSLTIILCYYGGASELNIKNFQNFLAIIGLEKIEKYSHECTSFVKHLKNKLSKTYGSLCLERKQISIACKTLLDGLKVNKEVKEKISVNVGRFNDDMFVSEDNFWNQVDVALWSQDLQKHGKTFLGIIQLLKLRKEFTTTKLNLRLQKVFERTLHRKKGNKYKKLVSEEEIRKFIEKLNADIGFILQVLMTSGCDMSSVKIYTCPKCMDFPRDKKDFFDHLYCHQRIHGCPFHDIIANIYKDIVKYSENTFLEEKEMFNSKEVNVDLTSTKKHHCERRDEDSLVQKKKASLVRQPNKSMSVQNPASWPKTYKSLWGGSHLSSFTPTATSDAKLKKPWGAPNLSNSGWNDSVKSSPYKASLPSYVDKYDSKPRMPHFIRDEYYRNRELENKNKYIYNTYLPDVYPISTEFQEIALDLKQTHAYQSVPTELLMYMTERIQKAWFNDAKIIIEARSAAQKSLKINSKNRKEYEDATSYFFDVLDNAWLFDVDMKFGHALVLNGKTSQNNWNYCPFCVHLSAYRGMNENLNRVSRRNGNSHVPIERKYMCTIKQNDTSAGKGKYRLRKHEFGGCVNLTQDQLICHLNDDVNPIMSKAMFAYMKVMFPTKSGNTYKIFKCLEDASEEGLKKKGVDNKKEVSVKKRNVITAAERNENNDKICALLSDITTKPDSIPDSIFVDKGSNEMEIDLNEASSSKDKGLNLDNENNQVSTYSSVCHEKVSKPKKKNLLLECVKNNTILNDDVFTRVLEFAKNNEFDVKRSRSARDWYALIEKDNMIPVEDKQYYGDVFSTNAKSFRYEDAYGKARKFVELYFKNKLKGDIEEIEDDYDDEEEELATLNEEEEKEFGTFCKKSEYRKILATRDNTDDCKEILNSLCNVIKDNETFDYGFQIREYERLKNIREKQKSFKFMCPCSYKKLDQNEAATANCHKKKLESLQSFLGHLCDTKCLVHQAVHIYISELYKIYLQGNNLYKDVVGILLLNNVVSTLADCELCPLLSLHKGRPQVVYLLYGCVGNHDWFKNCFANHIYMVTIRQLIKCGTEIKKGKRKVRMYCYGSTKTASNMPRLERKDGRKEMIPRPYAKFRPGSDTFNMFMNNKFFKVFTERIEELMYDYISSMDCKNDWTRRAYDYIKKSKKYVPESCRIFNTAFTFLSLNGEIGGSNCSDGIGQHTDDTDIISCVVHVGESRKKGGTVYFKKEGDVNVIKRVEFKNGNVQISDFSSIVHGTEETEGNRFSLTFSVKHTIVDWFEINGLMYYNQYVACDNFACKNKVIKI